MNIFNTLTTRVNMIRAATMTVLGMIFLFSGCGTSPEKSSGESQFQVRALWVDPPGFKDRETVDRLIEKCQAAGINTILPDIMLRGDVWFKSENFIGNVHANDEYDPLAYLIEKAHEAGIQVQPWSCTYLSIPKEPGWVSKPFVDNNYDYIYLSAAHPDVNPYLLSVLEELLEYDIDGIHLDYARYWNAAFDYSDAACNRFKESHGFNPRDFYDHPERIVSTAKDLYPVRVLCPSSATTNIATLGVLERNLNRAGAGYAYVSEAPANIDKLKAPGLLIVSFYNDVPEEMMAAIQGYVQRGGDVMWISPSNSLFSDGHGLSSLASVSGTEGFKESRLNLQVSDNRFGESIEGLHVKLGGASLITDDAEVIVHLDTGEPVVTNYQKEDEGNVVVVGFQLMYSDSPGIMQFFKETILALRSRAGITGPDAMAEKHEQWIDWRASHITELVREVNKMVKEKDPRLVVTTASGVGPQQYHGIYRDSRDLLTENIVDYIFPMNYTDELDVLRDILDEQALYTPDGMQDNIYPGLKLYTKGEDGTTISMESDMVAKQLQIVKEYGYKGFCLFAYSYFSDEIAGMLGRFNY